MVSDLQERDDLAAYMFPAEWARIATAPGKSRARNNLRKHAENRIVLDALRSAGRSCLSCDGRTHNRCEMLSDFSGNVSVPMDHLCVHWSPRK